MSGRIHLLRHATAAAAAPGGADGRRQLTEAGRREACAQGRLLAELEPDALTIAFSPARRCRETAELVTGARMALGRPGGEVVARDDLGLGGDVGSIRDWAVSTRPGTVLVGHEPGLLGLAAALLGERSLAFALRPATLARLERYGPREEGAWSLTLLVTADEARRLTEP